MRIFATSLTDWASTQQKKMNMKKFSSIYLAISFILMCGESKYWWWYLLVVANLFVSFRLFKKHNPEYIL